MKARLVSPESSYPEWEIELEQFPAIIGRSPHAEIQPLHPSVSQEHCELEEINGRLVVRDLGSECGTFVNGVQIEMAPLLPGDCLTVGQARFIAAYDPPEPSSPKSSRSFFNSDFPLVDATLFNLVELLEQQRHILRTQQSRQPEAMFPDPPHPEHIEHLIAEEMRIAGVEARFIYAFEQTGILLTEFNYDSISQEQRAEWHSAVGHYDDQHGDWDSEQRYPVGAVTLYGPDKIRTTMIVAAVLEDEQSEPIYQRWVGVQVKDDPQVKPQITEFFRQHGVRSVIYINENVGCPHQEGLDYPIDGECPFCPYWKGRQRD